MYETVKCARCGKLFLTSEKHTECPQCRNRRANGKRLAAENREARLWEAEYDARMEQQALESLGW